MGDDGFLVNTSRGRVVREDDLVTALQQGQILAWIHGDNADVPVLNPTEIAAFTGKDGYA